MQSLFPEELLNRIHSCGVVAVLVIDQVEHAQPLAQALVAGGIDAIELTLRTPAAADAMRSIRQHVPEVLIGAGTVLSPVQVDQVADAGAQFAVAPGLNPRVVERAKGIGLPFAPGVVTPSDIEQAIELGCRELKFFPAQPSGGMDYLKSMAAPYLHFGLRFIPLGGLSASNMSDYIRDPLISAIGGSWIAPRKLIQNEDWFQITSRAKEAREIVDRIRKGEDQ